MAIARTSGEKASSPCPPCSAVKPRVSAAPAAGFPPRRTRRRMVNRGMRVGRG